MENEGVRARARRELVQRITDAAREQLAQVGAAGLSVRAVTRELGMAPSAVYRYFPSRDALLTALIVDAFQGLADAASAAEAAVDRGDLTGRWHAVFRAVRAWGLAHPHEFALIYGSPVPGYVAPEETAELASRVSLLLAQIACESWAVQQGATSAAGATDGHRADLAAVFAAETTQHAGDLEGDIRRLQGYLAVARPDLALDGMPGDRALAVVDAWTELIGCVTFELFGHYRRVIDARAEHLTAVAHRTAARAGVL
ncbi:TetR/AcrR family transcriptional regulator [Cellulomonas sp. NPDC089187]|uniref:TetR/AcrR family transcriptional regulator n=1 Tax=Cellulomonas sp. NPDC089187 TaxID=3154970 RepID=UPI0034324D96